MENMDAVRVVDQSWLPCGHTNTYTANDARVHVMTHSSKTRSLFGTVTALSRVGRRRARELFIIHAPTGSKQHIGNKYKSSLTLTRLLEKIESTVPIAAHPRNRSPVVSSVQPKFY